MALNLRGVPLSNIAWASMRYLNLNMKLELQYVKIHDAACYGETL